MLSRNQQKRMNSFSPYFTYSEFSHEDLIDQGYRPIGPPKFHDVTAEAGYGCLDVGIKSTRKYRDSNGYTATSSFISWVQRVAPGDEYQLNNDTYRN